MHHILGNKVLEYDVDDRGVIVDEREIDRTVNHKPNIADWVKEHMVFWYDMSKPVDTYSQNFNDWRLHPSVNADIIITSTSFVITRFATLNDTVKCYIPDQTKNFPGMKVEVKGIVDGQELYWGYSADVKLVNITSDGTYDIPPLETVRSVDGTMILLHEDFVAPVLGDEEISSYLYDSNELSEILNSEVWTEMN